MFGSMLPPRGDPVVFREPGEIRCFMLPYRLGTGPQLAFGPRGTELPDQNAQVMHA